MMNHCWHLRCSPCGRYLAFALTGRKGAHIHAFVYDAIENTLHKAHQFANRRMAESYAEPVSEHGFNFAWVQGTTSW